MSVDLHFLNGISVQSSRLQADHSPPLSPPIQCEQNIHVLHLGSDVFRFWLAFQQLLDPTVRLLPTGSVLESRRSRPLFRV